MSKTSNRTNSVGKRIARALAVFVLTVAVIYCGATLYSIMYAESHLVGPMLGRYLDFVIERGISPLSFMEVFATGPAAGSFPAIPAWLADYPEGFSEVLAAGDPAFLFRRTVDGTTWAVFQSQHGFEDDEILIFGVVFAIMIISTLFAGLVGIWLAHAIVRPIEALADDVRAMAREKTFRPLKAETTDDEVGELARTFEATLKHLHETILREKAFTADVSHELRAPLTVIGTSCEMMLLRHPELANEIDPVQRAVAKLKEQVEVFLELARMDRGAKLSEDRDIAETAAAVVELHRAAAEKKGLTIEFVNKAGNQRSLTCSGPLSSGISSATPSITRRQDP